LQTFVSFATLHCCNIVYIQHGDCHLCIIFSC